MISQGRGVLLLAALITPAVCSDALGQAAWEYTPYQARVWIALERTPQLPDDVMAPIANSLQSRCSAVWGTVMQTQVSAAPAKLRSGMLHDLDELSVEAIVAA